MLIVSFSLEMYMLYQCDLVFLSVLPTISKNIVLVVFRLLYLKSEIFIYTTVWDYIPTRDARGAEGGSNHYTYTIINNMIFNYKFLLFSSERVQSIIISMILITAVI